MAQRIYRIGTCVESGCNQRFVKRGSRTRCDQHLKPMWKPGESRQATCLNCLAVFTPQPNRRTQVACSSACNEKLKFHMSRHGRWDICHLPICVVCDQPTGKGPRSYMCEKCKRRSGEESRWASGAGRLKNHRRRANVKDGENGITVLALRDRDGDFCTFCGFRIDFDAAAHSDLSPQIDHIVPVAAGGQWRWDNVQLLHARCNRKKGARVIPDFPSLFDEDIA